MKPAKRLTFFSLQAIIAADAELIIMLTIKFLLVVLLLDNVHF